MSLVSMANSDGISKRPILPASNRGPASTCGTSCPRGCDLAWRRARWHRSPSDPAHVPWRDCTRLRIGGGQAHGGVVLDASRLGAARRDVAFRHPLGASRQQPGQRGSARRKVRAVRLLRLLRRALWRRLLQHIAPGRRDPIGRPPRRLTAPPRQEARPTMPQPRPCSARPVARMPAAGKTADSTAGDDPSRHPLRRDRTNGRAAGGHGGSRLPTLVRRAPRSRYH
jgi:hypothetical protein